MLLMSFRKLIH